MYYFVMLQGQELESKSAEFGIHVSNVQRDYVLGWLLYAIYSSTELKDVLFLKGGNALRKCYFAQTRYSGDVDFGTENDIDPEFLRTELTKACDTVGRITGIVFKNENMRIQEHFKTLTDEDQGKLKVFDVRIYFREFYTHSDHITIKVEMDVTRFDRTILPIQSRPLLHPYSDHEQLSSVIIQCVKAEEILATKLKCILQREHAPDLFDLVFPELFPPGFEIDKSELVFTFLKRTIFEPSPAVIKNILLKTPFDFFRAQWNKSVICAKSIFFDAEIAIRKFTDLLQALFARFPDYPYNEALFFGPELRVPIMKAARTQTLLKMVYNGYERVVEPYSLKYMQPRNGPAREYFFVWNRTGGSQGQPGLRMLLPDRVQSIENTSERFDPQFEIELCKAGEPVADPLLYDPYKQGNVSGTGKRWSTRHTTSRNGPRYVFRCSVCKRLFYKASYDGSLGAHKAKFGQQCYGSFGSYVKTIYG